MALASLQGFAAGSMSSFMSGSQVALGQSHISNAPSCPNAQLSCHNTSVVENLCCFNYPGGKMLSTQFWDTNPPTGPSDTWTLHGLWPDHCDGSFDAYCDNTRNYNNISDILTSFGETTLLNSMSTFWKDYQGDDENLWKHEWQKHGTCVSTLKPSCYGEDYKGQEEVADYFRAAVAVYKQLPTFQWLAEAGIVPSLTETYSSEQIQTVLRQKHGMPVSLGCKGNKFDEVWYHFDVMGSIQTGVFYPSIPDGGKSTCPQFGIRYPPKGSPGGGGGGSHPTHPTRPTHRPTGTATAIPTSTGEPFAGKGILNVYAPDEKTGCIISGGTWYVSGTCAKFYATSANAQDLPREAGQGQAFTLSSTKGDCAIVHGALTCAKTIRKPSVFTAGENGLLSYGNNNATFFADGVPRGWRQANVFVEPQGHHTQLRIAWQSV